MQTDIELIRQAMNAFSPHYLEASRLALQEAKFEGYDWLVTFVASGLAGEPYSADFHQLIAPYRKKADQEEMIKETAARGFLEEVAPGQFKLTAAGQQGIDGFFKNTAVAINPLEPLPSEKMDRLADLLHRIIAATVSSEKPEHKRWILLSRATDNGTAAPAVIRIDQYLTDLLRYRDDAHIGAFSEHDVPGHVWEAFAIVSDGEANTAAKLAERLANRGYEESDYATALSELSLRGWVSEKDGVYSTTSAGTALRQQVEDQTNAFYYQGWSQLSEAEISEMNSLLEKLRDTLTNLAADNATAAFSEVREITTSISGSLFALTRPSVDPVMEKLSLTERGVPFSLIQARGYHPDTVSGTKIKEERFPYATAESWDSRLEKLVELGYLEKDGEFSLTEAGQDAMEKILGAFRSHLDQLTEALNGTDLDNTAGLLRRVVRMALNGNTPNQSLRRSQGLTPDDDASALVKIDQYLDDLNAFRDDAHIAAFNEFNVSGHAWELFSNIWQAEVKNAEEFAEKAGFRGHSLESYQAAQKDLVQRGWVAVDAEGVCTVTEAGLAVREAAEVQTDRNYYIAWTALVSADAEALKEALGQLDAQLKLLVEAVPA
jgi:Mn-dependent DtxR family transcriptional regulator